MSAHATLDPRPQAGAATRPALLQRKCACGTRGAGTCATCSAASERDKDKHVQRRGQGPAPAAPATLPSVQAALASPGHALGAPTRAAFEPLFGTDFSRVRVHADESAARSAREIAAEAYTVGHDVVFAHGRFAPETRAGRALLAHELTHVVQQRAGLSARLSEGPAGEAHEREADAMAERAASAPAAGALIVDNEAPSVAPGQLRLRDFARRLHPVLCRAADAELARVGRDSHACPYIERAFAHYETQPAAQVERALRRFAPRAARANTADELIAAVAERVAAGVRQWATTGALPELPEGLSLDLPGGMFGGLLGGAAGLLGGLSRLFFKVAPGAPAPSAAGLPAAALPAGAPLASGLRERMSGALGHALPDVRVHTSSEAAALNARLGSRAFTLGRHVAFGSGEYQPGTPVGDALLAHELAHVVQQGRDVDATTLPGARLPSPGDAALEADADEAATGAVLSLWGRTTRGLRELRQQTGPRLKSGLRLQMSNCGSDPPPAARVAPRQVANPPAQVAPQVPAVAATCPPALENPRWNVVPAPIFVRIPGCRVQLGRAMARDGDAFGLNGMEFKATLRIAPSCPGSFYFAQFVRPQRTLVGCVDSRPVADCAAPGWGIDTQWPYAHGSRGSTDGAAARGVDVQTVDAPGQGSISSAGFTRLCFNDEFVTFLVHEDPSGTKRPLAWMHWLFNATVARDGGGCPPTSTSNDCNGWAVVNGNSRKIGEDFTGRQAPPQALDPSAPIIDGAALMRAAQACDPASCGTAGASNSSAPVPERPR